MNKYLHLIARRWDIIIHGSGMSAYTECSELVLGISRVISIFFPLTVERFQGTILGPKQEGGSDTKDYSPTQQRLSGSPP